MVNSSFFFLPIGALTSKVYSFSSRPWELMIRQSVDFFDFFGLPTSVYVDNSSQLFRISAFNMQFWISDSTRFIVNFLDYHYVKLLGGGIKVRFNSFFYKVSWLELRNFVNNRFFSEKVCDMDGIYNDCCFFPILFPENSSLGYSNGKNFSNPFLYLLGPARSADGLRVMFFLIFGGFFNIYKQRGFSNFNFFSIGKFVDIKDFSVISSIFSRQVNSTILFLNFVNFNINNYKSRRFFYNNDFSTFENTDICFENKFISERINAIFIFDSNLRYESPVLNIRIKRCVDAHSDCRIYFFGEVNFIYFLPYYVNYCGGLDKVIQFFTGRLNISKMLFYKSVSIFGFGFLDSSVFRRVHYIISSNLFFVISVIPEFLQNSVSVFKDSYCSIFRDNLFFYSKNFFDMNFFFLIRVIGFRFLKLVLIIFFHLMFKNFCFLSFFILILFWVEILIILF